MIKNIEKKFKLSFGVAIGSVLISAVTIIIVLLKTYSFVEKQREKVYVLDNGIPLLLTQSEVQENRGVERYSHVNTFHKLFFTLPPDNVYIQENIKEAAYMADESIMFEYRSLQEKRFYSTLISTSTNMTIKTDSIVFNEKNGELVFDYYGVQRLDRRSSTLLRQIHTRGSLRDIQRSSNNPHGIIIEKWRTISNNDLQLINKG